MRAIRAFAVTVVTIVTAGALLAASALALQSEWEIAEEPLYELGLKEEKDTLSGGAFSLSVPSKSLVIQCKAVEGSGADFEGGTDKFKASLSKCEVVKSPLCEVSEPVVIEGKTESILVGTTYYDKVVPLTEGKALMTVGLTGEACALPEENEVTGAVAAKVSSESLVKQPLAFSEEISKSVNSTLKESGEAELALTSLKSTAYLSGEFTMQLGGANAGQPMRRAEFTRLCESALGANNTCTGKVVASGGALNMVKTGAMKFEFGTTTVTCTEAKIEGNTLSVGAAPVPADLSVFAFNICNMNQCPVTTTATNLAPYRTFFETNGQGAGHIWVRNPRFKIVCNGTTCEYGELRIAFNLISGNPALLRSAPQTITRRLGPMGVCGEHVVWEGGGIAGAVEYEFLAPKPLYLTG